MNGRFLITGLPRCRTAWFAEAAKTSRSSCVHEPIKYLTHWRDVYGIWRAPGRGEFTGISDSSLGFHLGEILDVAAPRTLIVHRPVEEVEYSLRKQGFAVDTNYCTILEKRLEQFWHHPLVQNVSFPSLGEVECVIQCLQHLMPGVRFDLDRLDQLVDTNIQADLLEARKSAAERVADLPALLGEDVIAELRSK